MNNELIERLDLWIAEYDRPAYSQIVLLLKDCKFEIQLLRQRVIDLQEHESIAKHNNLESLIVELDRWSKK